MKTVLILGKKCGLQFGKYPNGTLAMIAIYRKQDFLALSVNWQQYFQGEDYAASFPFPCIVLKNYSENEGIVKQLEAGGVIEKGGAYLAGSGGTVEARLLTKEFKQLAQEQLNIKD